MKRIVFIGLACLGLILATSAKADAQIEIIGEIAKRVIMAIDLWVQKLQTQTIVLQDAQKQVENLMQETHLADIADWVGQQKDLYREYYNELWEVKNALVYYSAVKDMIDKEARLVNGYQQAYKAVKRDSHFSADELAGMAVVYQGMLGEGGLVVEELSTVINAFSTQMDDADRLGLINALSSRIDRSYRQLQAFTQSNILLSLQRSKDSQDINMLKALYGIQ